MIHRTVAKPLMLLVGMLANLSGNAALGQLLGSDDIADTLIQIDPVTAAVKTIGPLGDPVVASLTYDFDHDILYGSSSINDNLLVIDPTSGATTVVGSFGVGLMHGLEYNANNNVLYGISNATNELYSINTASGAVSAIGPTGLGAVGGMAFDVTNNVMYATNSLYTTDTQPSRTNGLFTIDLTTGAASLVGPLNHANVVQMTGLAWDPRPGGGLFGSDNKLLDAVDDELFAIDPANGQATSIGTLSSRNTLGLTFIPEPSAALLVLAGAACLALSRRRAVWQRRFQPLPD